MGAEIFVIRIYECITYFTKLPQAIHETAVTDKKSTEKHILYINGYNLKYTSILGWTHFEIYIDVISPPNHLPH